MKRIIPAFILCFIILLACNNEKESNSSHEVEGIDHAHATVPETKGLELNNGQKWKSDISTDKNVAILSDNIYEFEARKDTSEANFRRLANELQAGINLMVNECRMKGPDHDALHQWLEPLIKNIKDLEKQAGSGQATLLVKEISARLKLYPQYFSAS